MQHSYWLPGICGPWTFKVPWTTDIEHYCVFERTDKFTLVNEQVSKQFNEFEVFWDTLTGYSTVYI